MTNKVEPHSPEATDLLTGDESHFYSGNHPRQAEFDAAMALMPPRGPAESLLSETLRALYRLYHDEWNNGGFNWHAEIEAAKSGNRGYLLALAMFLNSQRFNMESNDAYVRFIEYLMDTSDGWELPPYELFDGAICAVLDQISQRAANKVEACPL